MEDRAHNTWDIVVKILGFITTAVSIYIGISQFTNQQKAASELELDKNFWTSQNLIYTEICKNAGAMVAGLSDSQKFANEKAQFLTHYYGEMVLVEDPNVEKSMIAIRSYLEVFEPGDANMVIVFKRKVLQLSNACKRSSATFKRANLK